MYNKLCSQLYDCRIKDLEKKQNKTDEEKYFIYKYKKYTPLMDNNSTMNYLSKYIENIEFDNKWAKKQDNFDYNILISNEYIIDDKNLIKKIISLLKEFDKSQKISILNREYAEDIIDEEEYNDSLFSYLFELYEEKLLNICSNKQKLSDYVVYVYYNYFKNKSKSLMWNVFSDEILHSVKSKSKKICYPVRDESGVEYLGRRYILKEVDL